MSGSGESSERLMIATGCLMAMGSALVTCLMLFINGSLVMALLTTFARSGPRWVSKPEFTQFMLFLMPVVLVVVQWLMIDYVRKRFQSRPSR